MIHEYMKHMLHIWQYLYRSEEFNFFVHWSCHCDVRVPTRWRLNLLLLWFPRWGAVAELQGALHLTRNRGAQCLTYIMQNESTHKMMTVGKRLMACISKHLDNVEKHHILLVTDDMIRYLAYTSHSLHLCRTKGLNFYVHFHVEVLSVLLLRLQGWHTTDELCGALWLTHNQVRTVWRM